MLQGRWLRLNPRSSSPIRAATWRLLIGWSRRFEEHGFEPLIDRAEIYAFEDWWKRIDSLISRADTVAFVLSPDAIASEVCGKEVAHALALNKRLAPIVARRANDDAIPEALRRLNFIFFDDPEKFEASLARLVEALQTDIGWIRKHTEYGEAARQWTAAGRPSGLLLRSPALGDEPSDGLHRAHRMHRCRQKRPRLSLRKAAAAPRAAGIF